MEDGYSSQFGPDPTGTGAPPPPPAPHQARRLVRRRHDKVIGGVCSGVADYFDVDPVIVRICWVAAAFAGPGVLAYIIAWIAIPEAGSKSMLSQVSTHVPTTRDPAQQRTIAIVALVGSAILITASSWNWWWGGSSATLALVLVGGGLWLLLHDRSGRDAGDPYGPPPTGPAVTWSPPTTQSPAATETFDPITGEPIERYWWEDYTPVGTDPTMTDDANASLDAHPEHDGDSGYDADDTEVSPAGRDPLLEEADRLRDPTLWGPWYAPEDEVDPPPPPDGPSSGMVWAESSPAPRAPRGKSILGRLTFGVLCAAAGVAWLVAASGAWSPDIVTILAGGLLIVGMALLIGAWWGRAHGLIFLGIALVLGLSGAALIDVPIGGVGDREFAPTSPSELARQTPYELGVGELTVDLTHLGSESVGGKDLEVDASLGIGELIVLVPDGSGLDIDAESGLGEVLIVGEKSQSGADVAVHTNIAPDPGERTYELDLEVGVGQITIDERSPR